MRYFWRYRFVSDAVAVLQLQNPDPTKARLRAPSYRTPIWSSTLIKEGYLPLLDSNLVSNFSEIRPDQNWLKYDFNSDIISVPFKVKNATTDSGNKMSRFHHRPPQQYTLQFYQAAFLAPWQPRKEGGSFYLKILIPILSWLVKCHMVVLDVYYIVLHGMFGDLQIPSETFIQNLIFRIAGIIGDLLAHVSRDFPATTVVLSVHFKVLHGSFGDSVMAYGSFLQILILWLKLSQQASCKNAFQNFQT